MPKPTAPEVQALIATRNFMRADVYIFNLNGGGTLYYGGHDRDISFNGNVYPCGGATGPYFDRKSNKAKLHQKYGVQTDTLVVDVLPGSATVFGAPFIQACTSGQFDAALVTVYRVYMDLTGKVIGGRRVFDGRVAEVDAGRSIVTFTLNSYLELLNQMFPRNVIQPGCLNNVYDPLCGANPADFQVNGTVGGGSTSSSIVATLTLPIAGYFNQGKVVFTSGVLNGLSRSVQTADSSGFQVVPSFPSAPAPGDTFEIFPGCDRSFGAPVQVGATLTSGSPNVTLAEPVVTAGNGTPVVGSVGIPAGTLILSITGTSLVMTKNATANGASTLTLNPSSNGCAKFSRQGFFRGFIDVPQATQAL